MTHSWLMTQVSWLIFIHNFHTFIHKCHDSFIHVTWLIQICATTHSYMWNDSFILGGKQVCFTMTHTYIWHVSCILGGQQVCITEDMWLHTVHLWRDAYVYDWFIYACVIQARAMPLLCMCQDPFMTHSHVWHLASLLVVATLKDTPVYRPLMSRYHAWKWTRCGNEFDLRSMESGNFPIHYSHTCQTIVSEV